MLLPKEKYTETKELTIRIPPPPTKNTYNKNAERKELPKSNEAGRLLGAPLFIKTKLNKSLL